MNTNPSLPNTLARSNAGGTDAVQVASFCLSAVGACLALFFSGMLGMAFGAFAVFVGSFPGRGRRAAMIAGGCCFAFGFGAILLGIIARALR